MIEEDDYEIKVIFLGKTAVGKTNIMNILQGLPFNLHEISTMTSSFFDKSIIIKNKKYNLQIWDTCGKEKYRSLANIFMKDAKIVILVYSIIDRGSFEEIDYWFRTAKDILGNGAIFALIGNKNDLFTQEEVSEEEGKRKANEIGALFKLTSAKTWMGLKDFYKSLLEAYLRKLSFDIRRVK